MQRIISLTIIVGIMEVTIIITITVTWVKPGVGGAAYDLLRDELGWTGFDSAGLAWMPI